MANPTYVTTPWATTTDVAAHWKDAPVTAATIDRLLSVATISCRSYAPALADSDTIPDNYVLAVIYQARELHNAILRGETDIIGVGDYAIRARPLPAVVRATLRPEPGVPVLG